MGYASNKKVLEKLYKLRNSQETIVYRFLELSLEWIEQKANHNLDTRINNPDSRFNEQALKTWNKTITTTSAILENSFENSASVEFGIGIVGQESPDDNALRLGFEYNVPSEHKNENGYWTFRLPDGTFITINGYKGKSFLHRALKSYSNPNVWLKLYDKAFKEVMRGK